MSFKMLAVVIIACGVACCGLVVGVAKGYFDTTPTLNAAEINDQALTSFIYDCKGELMTTYSGSENRIWTDYDNIPRRLIDAFVSVEDTRFWTHNGIDIKRIAGALVSNLSGGSTQGGSTITQQLIKLTVLSSDVSYKRKLQEAFLAVQLEKEYTKYDIIESYLNTIWLGESNYGVASAAQDYFGKSLDELTLRECAVLAGMTKSPNKYDPRKNYYTRGTPEVTNDRADLVLHYMLETNSISQEEYDAAMSAELSVVEASEAKTLYEYPHAVETVIDDVVAAMLKARGMANNSTNRSIIRSELRSGGYRIYSTIDTQVQAILEDVVYNWDSYPEMANASDTATFSTTSDGTVVTVQPQVAAVIIDHETGGLRAIVGSRTAPAQYLTFNRARSSTMPVGSSIKPLAVYGPALDVGLSPATVTEDMPIPIEGWNTGKGYPANSSSNAPPIVTLRYGMVRSLNIGSAHTLLDYVGLSRSTDYLTSMGVNKDHLNIDAFGLALGSSGITPYEMASAYTAIANNGVYQKTLSFTRIEDMQGNVIVDMEAEQRRTAAQVFQESTDFMLVDMLVNAVKSGTGTRAQIEGLTVGGKTGTNSDNVGVSFVGITPYYSCSVWIGHDEYKPLSSSTYGSNAAAPLWQAVMARVHSELELENKPITDKTGEELGLVKVTTCSLTGKLATDACALCESYKPVTDWWRPEDVPGEYCTAHQLVEVCDETGKLATDACQLKHTECRIVISPDVSIFKYERGILLPFFKTALFSAASLKTDETFASDEIMFALTGLEVYQQDAAEGSITVPWITASPEATPEPETEITRIYEPLDPDPELDAYCSLHPFGGSISVTPTPDPASTQVGPRTYNPPPEPEEEY